MERLNIGYLLRTMAVRRAATKRQTHQCARNFGAVTRLPLRMITLCFCVLILAACDSRECLRYETKPVTTYSSSCPSYLKYCASGTPTTTYQRVCVAYKQPNRRLEESASYKKFERERAAAKAKAAHDKYWTPERLKKYNSPAEKRKRAAASKRYAAQRKKEEQARVAAARDIRKRWTREHRLALRNNRAPLRKFPEHAWLSGIWCIGTSGKNFHRYEILNNGRIRKISYSSGSSSYGASNSTSFHAVRRKDGLYMLTRIQYPTVKNPYELKSGKSYSEWAIRKLNDNQYSMEWSRSVYPYRSIFKPGGPGKKKVWNNKYRRCEIG